MTTPFPKLYSQFAEDPATTWERREGVEIVRTRSGKEYRSGDGMHWVQAPKVFALYSTQVGGPGGEEIDLGEFVRDNDLEPEEVNAIGAMQPGDEMNFGGGAGVLFTLRRVS